MIDEQTTTCEPDADAFAAFRRRFMLPLHASECDVDEFWKIFSFRFRRVDCQRRQQKT